MKTTKLFLAAVFTLFLSIANANNTEPTKSDVLRSEITKLMSKIDWDVEKTFTITFLLNSNNEIIVTSTSDKEVDSEVKSILNYKKINISSKIMTSELFTIPIKIKKA